MATRRIETELALSGEKEFNDAMKGVNANLKNIRADMARVTAEFDGNADSMEALTAKEKVLRESVEQHRAKVDALRRMYEEQKKKYGENSAAADKYRLQLTQATTAMIKEENALKKTTAAIADKKAADLAAAAAAKKLENAAGDAADAAEDLADAEEESAEEAERAAKKQERLAKASDLAKKGLGSLETAAKGAGKGLAVVGKSVGAVSGAAMAGVAAIGAGGVAVLGAMSKMALEAAEAAKAAAEAGEPLTESQQKFLGFSNQLDALKGSATNAKSAIAEIMLPMLGDLSAEGGAFLDAFVKDMSAAAGDTGKQSQILGKYIADGAKLILEKLPEYINAGKEILGSIVEGFEENGDELLDMGMAVLMDLLKFIMDNAPALADAGLEMLLQVIEGMDGQDLADTASDMVSKIVNVLAKAAPVLLPAAAKLVGDLVIGLAKNAPQLIGSAGELIIILAKGLIAAVGELRNAARDILNIFIEQLRSSDSEFLQFGADVIDWIANGILDAWDGLVDWFNGLWDGLFSGREVDVPVNGTATGGVDGSHASGLRYVPFDGYLAELHRGEAVLPAAEAAAYRSGKYSGSKVLNLTINTTSLAQADMDMIVGYINRKFGEAM